VLGAVAVALAEARTAAAGEEAHPPFLDLALADLGVLAPLALAVGAAVSIAALFPSPRRRPRARRPT
jgi:hypothetical protein